MSQDSRSSGSTAFQAEVAPPLAHGVTQPSSIPQSSRPEVSRSFPTYAEERFEGDEEGATALQKINSRLSQLSKEESNDLLRSLSRRSTRRSKITAMTGNGDEEPDSEFNRLLAEIFDVGHPRNMTSSPELIAFSVRR